MKKSLLFLPVLGLFGLVACTGGGTNISTNTGLGPDDNTNSSRVSSSSTSDKTSVTDGSKSDSDTSSKTEPSTMVTIHFQDEAWWNTAAASTHVLINGEEELTQMTYDNAIGYVKVTAETGWNAWSIEVDTSVVTTLTFVRTGTEEGVLKDWGARTAPINLADRGDNDTYTIQGTTEAWYNNGNGKTVEGKWTTYEAVQQQKADTPPVAEA